MRKGRGGKPLQNEAHAVALLRLAEDAIGVVDVAAAIVHRANERCGEVIGRESLLYAGFQVFLIHSFSFQIQSGCSVSVLPS